MCRNINVKDLLVHLTVFCLRSCRMRSAILGAILADIMPHLGANHQGCSEPVDTACRTVIPEVLESSIQPWSV